MIFDLEGQLGIRPKVGLRVKPSNDTAFNIMETINGEESSDEELEDILT